MELKYTRKYNPPTTQPTPTHHPTNPHLPPTNPPNPTPQKIRAGLFSPGQCFIIYPTTQFTNVVDTFDIFSKSLLKTPFTFFDGDHACKKDARTQQDSFLFIMTRKGHSSFTYYTYCKGSMRSDSFYYQHLFLKI